MQVRNILKIKGTALFTVTAAAPLIDAVETMAEHDIGSLIVITQGALTGILTFREVIRALRAHQGAILTATVADVMNRDPRTCTLDTDINQVRTLMLDHHVRYLPVMDAETLMGVISFYDVAKAMVEEQRFENKMLKAYIRN
jgi:CBS domain-containing protein